MNGKKIFTVIRVIPMIDSIHSEHLQKSILKPERLQIIYERYSATRGIMSNAKKKAK